jgi:transposase
VRDVVRSSRSTPQDIGLTLATLLFQKGVVRRVPGREPRDRHHEVAALTQPIAVRQVHDEEVRLLLDPVDDNGGLAKFSLAVPLLGTASMSAVEAVLADRAHDDSDAILAWAILAWAILAWAILAWIVEQDVVPVIPPRPSRITTRETGWCLDKERAGIECLFGKTKHFRRVFSRFDKLARRYLASVHLVAACILLR